MRYHVYLAGPISSFGDVESNIAMFDLVARQLRQQGYQVYSPPEDEDHKNDRWTWKDYMAKDLPHLVDAEFVILLPGWEHSQGTRFEVFVARTLGKPINKALFLDGDYMHSIDAATDEELDHHVSNPKWVRGAGDRWADEQDEHESILAEANRIVTQDRNNQYGPPDTDLNRTAGLWTELFKTKLKDGEVFKGQHVAHAMICLKLSRAQWMKKRDTYVDCAGYSAIAHKLEFGSW